MGWISSICKCLLYGCNVVFVIIGIVLITNGSMMLSNMQKVTDFEGSVKSISFPVSVLSIGCVTFLVAVFGCFGTIRGSACLTKTYSVCILVLCFLQISLSIWLYVESDVFLAVISDIVDSAWADKDAEHHNSMDNLQLDFQCCGNAGYEDYGGQVPASCCGYTDRSKQCDISIYSTRPGCKAEFVDFLASNLDIIRWSSLGVALLELGISAVSCRLAQQMKRSEVYPFSLN